MQFNPTTKRCTGCQQPAHLEDGDRVVIHDDSGSFICHFESGFDPAGNPCDCFACETATIAADG